MEVFIIILLSLVVTGCSYVIWNLNSKVINYENRIEEYETWINNFSDTVKDVDEVIKIALTKELKPVEWMEVEVTKSKDGEKISTLTN